MIRPFLEWRKPCCAILAVLLAIVLSAVAVPAAAAGRERILQFDSEVWIHRDGSMTVRETIEVESAGDQIKRGIYRDFPTVYHDRRGTRIVVAFDLDEVQRDGRAEPYHTQRQGNGIRVYIGDKDVYLRPGRYTYTLTYRTDRQLGYFDGFDELYWNVTGNGWAFDIERARAIIHLPEGARVRDYAAYTGAAGAQGQDFTYSPLVDGTVRFDTTRTLRPGDGLTIAVAWLAGLVERPSGARKVSYFVSDNSVLVAGTIGLGVLLLYYLYVWAQVGRDPEKGVIVPQYEPPAGVTPAGARYVMEYAFDDKVFTAAVVNMAVKGYLTIKESADKVFTLAATGKSAPLSPGERAIAGKLFPRGRGEIELKQQNHSKLGAAQNLLHAKLRTEFEKSHFVHNTGYLIPGIAISVLVLLLVAMVSDETEAAIFITIWLTFWTGAVYFLFRQCWRAWQAAAASGSIADTLKALITSAFALPFFGGEILGLWFFAEMATVGGAAVLIATQLVNAVFYHLLKAPTLLGRRLMDRIEGFKLYLSVAEQDRMNMLNPPERTPALFEKFLPYALALGVEQQWSEQFSGVLAQAGAAPADGTHRHGYSPGWYAGRGLDRGLAGFSSALGGAFAGAIASASTAPGSSSGSGGGGSSGGGGGGGGGGGW
jgi:hypothetical protein